MSNEEKEISILRESFLIKMIRQTYDRSQKEKNKGNEIRYKALYNKYLTYKNELEELRKVI
jgi:hypothetical protein